MIEEGEGVSKRLIGKYLTSKKTAALPSEALAQRLRCFFATAFQPLLAHPLSFFFIIKHNCSFGDPRRKTHTWRHFWLLLSSHNVVFRRSLLSTLMVLNRGKLLSCFPRLFFSMVSFSIFPFLPPDLLSFLSFSSLLCFFFPGAFTAVAR